MGEVSDELNDPQAFLSPSVCLGFIVEIYVSSFGVVNIKQLMLIMSNP